MCESPITTDCVRKPNHHELTQLERWLVKETGMEEDEAHALARSAYVAVFPHYIPESPGYTGKVMVVVWPGGPGVTTTFIWPPSEPFAVSDNYAGARSGH